MYSDERLEVYLSTVKSDGDESLSLLRKKALEDNIPIIRPAAERYLITELRLTEPKRILEIGAAVGYSAIVMAYNTEKAHITTVESYAPRIEKARDNIKSFVLEDRIELLAMDADLAISDLLSKKSEFDFIFLDAAKGQYIKQWPALKAMLTKRGLLIADNVLQEGSVIDSRFAVERRDRTIHQRMREFISVIFSDPDMVCDVIPIGDGLATAVKL